MTNLKRFAMIALFSIIATACSTQQPIKSTESKPSATKEDTSTIKNLLLQAESETGLKAAQLKLQAAKLMLVNQKYTDSIALLNSIEPQSLPEQLSDTIAIAKAQAFIGLKDGNSTINILSSITDKPDYSNAQQAIKYQLLASAYGLTNQLDKEVTALITANDYNDNSEEQLSLNEQIWQLFKTLDTPSLQAINQDPDNSYSLRGWLALIIKFKETPNTEKVISNQWYKTWGAHIAAKYQPIELAQYLSREPLHNVSYEYSHVLVALPAAGKYAKGASAVLAGIKLAATQAQNSTVQVSYIDSSQYNSAADILRKAEELNADAIIGPLDRNLVAQFAQIKTLPLPVLALNSSPISNSNLYLFALSDDDEVRDAAQRAFNDGQRNILVLAPEGDKGMIAANTFNNQFNSLGGQVVSTTFYDTNEGNVTNAIAQMLQLDQVEIRKLQKKLKTAELRDKIHTMIRKDVDAIFLFASASDAYQIGPSILYFYADNLPLYTTSRVYSGKSNPVKNVDLNGMMFGDLPWVLTPSNDKQVLATQFSNTDSRFGRLYAFGIDALNLAPSLYNLSSEPESSILGETGQLSISAENLVEKSLTWAQFINGEAVPIIAQ
ncbi:MAG: penicillin-binding protein activator [Oceanospirillaceae bacterium]|nr:penicillin-binding protein activator [Oceanospirillaceae bacterium]